MIIVHPCGQGSHQSVNMSHHNLRRNNLKGAWPLGSQARAHACVHACKFINAHAYTYMILLHSCGQGSHQSVKMTHQHAENNNLKDAWGLDFQARTHACVHARMHTNAHVYTYMRLPHPCGQGSHQSVKVSHQNLKDNNLKGAWAMGLQASTHACVHACTHTNAHVYTYMVLLHPCSQGLHQWVEVSHQHLRKIIPKAHGDWFSKHAHTHAYTHARTPTHTHTRT